MPNKLEKRIETYVDSNYPTASKELKTHAYVSYTTGMNDERKIIINHIRRNIKKYIIVEDGFAFDVNKLINDINKL